MTTAVKRACDACHRRKVKCDGINPCRNCSAAQLGCTYNAVPQKKGPKGSRAKVISELRETQNRQSLSAKVQNRLNGVASPTAAAPSLAPNQGLLTPEIMKACLDFYFANMYPNLPILHRQRLEQQSMYIDSHVDTYCFLTAFCAFVILQPGMNVPGTPPSNDPYGFDAVLGANIISGTLLMEESIRVRKGIDHLESPTLNGICTSYFLYACNFALENQKKAWYYLREATTLMHMNGMNKEETYLQYDMIDASRYRRLYWLLFVTERSYALQQGRPLTLQATINIPTVTDDTSDPLAPQLNGFIMLVKLFRPFDDALVNRWNKIRNDCSAAYLGDLGNQFSRMLPVYASADGQFHDAATNQQWVKNLAWQINMPPDHANQAFQVDISRELMAMASSFVAQGVETSNGLIEKLLTITSDLTDVLALLPASRSPYIDGPRQFLASILDILAVLRSGEQRFTPLLLSKLHDILPKITSPMLQNAPENSCNVDIFDGFGNAGMAQPPCLDDYDSKFSVPRIEEFKTESSPSGGSAPSTNDLNSPYSPQILTPSMEYPHGLQADFSAMNDMVMSPLGGATAATLNSNGGLNAQNAVHQQHNLMSTLQGMNPGVLQNLEQVQALSAGLGHGFNSAMTSIGSNGIALRQQPQRSNSFAMPPPQIRTVGDFHALQRASSDLSSLGHVNMDGLGTELNFNTLR